MKHFIIILFFLLGIKGILNAQNSQLFLLAGQSNAVGQGDLLESTVCHPNTAFEFDADANDFIPLKDPAGKSWKLFQQAGTGSMAPAFAKRINELTGQPFYMVTAARGSTERYRNKNSRICVF
jgi:hypothetical protein